MRKRGGGIHEVYIFSAVKMRGDLERQQSYLNQKREHGRKGEYREKGGEERIWVKFKIKFCGKRDRLVIRKKILERNGVGQREE